MLAAKFPEVGIGLVGVSLAFGLTVVTMAYAVGHISGGHFNPAVTLGLLAGGRVKTADVVPYIVAQVANAVLAAWNLGERAEDAIADVVSGRVNPGGKLPLTLSRNAGQMPAFYNVKPSARRGYLFDTTEPLYTFGSGLGYSTFTLVSEFPEITR